MDAEAVQRRILAQVTACSQILEAARAYALGPESPAAAASAGPQVEAQHQKRQGLLEEKRLLAVTMEELRSTMRGLQEEGEKATAAAHSSSVRALATRTMVFASQDELDKVREQIRRSREQVAQHAEANGRLTRELHSCTAAFSEAIAAEMDSHANIQQEVEMLTKVTEDLESRLRNKTHDIEQARESNAEARAMVATATENWRRAHRLRATAFERGPIGACLSLLQQAQANLRQTGTQLRPSSGTAGADQLIRREGLPQEVPAQGVVVHGHGQQSARAELPPGESHTLDLATLRQLVSSKEEQLATLHRKIRFLSECTALDRNGVRT